MIVAFRETQARMPPGTPAIAGVGLYGLCAGQA